jgi:hypothetical protein
MAIMRVKLLAPIMLGLVVALSASFATPKVSLAAAQADGDVAVETKKSTAEDSAKADNPMFKLALDCTVKIGQVLRIGNYVEIDGGEHNYCQWAGFVSVVGACYRQECYKRAANYVIDRLAVGLNEAAKVAKRAR